MKWCSPEAPNDFSVCNLVQSGRFFEALKASDVQSIVMSSVVSADWNRGFSERCQQELNLSPVFVSVEPIFASLTVGYKDHASLGVDRWLSMVAAVKAYPGDNLVVLGAGSAITVDYVEKGGRHLGGMIAPGITAVIESFGQKAANVKVEVSGLESSWCPGDTTQACVGAGMSCLYGGFFKEVIREAPFLNAGFKGVVAGGDAPLIKKIAPPALSSYVHPALVLEGLGVWSAIRLN